MRSLRTRITVTIICVIYLALAVTTLLSAVFIRRTESRKTDQLLLMLCKNGQQSLDYYFDSVQNSVERVVSFVEEDLKGTSDDELIEHVENARDYFGMMASKTKGVLTYYYRIDPSFSSNVKGFWYTNLSGQGFEEHKVTDITLYDVNDTSKLVWFTVPKHEGKSIWLTPYITDNLDVRVISYDAPVYYKGQFIGVVGIEVDYSTMAEEVDSIQFYNDGYAYLSDENGKLFYHPRVDVTDATVSHEIPFSMTGKSSFVRYQYNGEAREAVWLPLSNGMRLVVSVPVSETKGDWMGLVLNISLGTVVVLVVASLFLMIYTRRITRPLEQLTEAAEQVEKGNYDIDLPYDEDDELGRLTRSFKKLSDNTKIHINDLNEQVYVDALTHVKNKGAYEKMAEELQEQIDKGDSDLEFAIGAFDCDNLKVINDQYGHDKGDVYLNAACGMISSVFKRSPVFRMGGDEFSVILKNEDYKNLTVLLAQFDVQVDKINASGVNPWEQIWISKGFACFDPGHDTSVAGVMKRADELMYDDKRERKSSGKIKMR
ncbi:diguanylate cyclase (GGDEF) domain-containing protein [Butyrivibrio sp. Su6]|uniref:sensor domain-containing diguanylate cyclase n=1 Tax=Butyrivibrio sp. Su6 TaxID=1520810 RepID=UPI00089F2568|nr:sensor domain-containing diguanylate cyclase [Butyrivibrio sp. Su6]SEF73515.1 diguanylate cyclase (GGDEF) domain-containing protein [Butyrivibrio sp. Su6]